VTAKRDPFSLHPFAVISSLGAAGQENAWAATDAEPEPEREVVHQRLRAVIGRRLDSTHAPSARTERAT
jgi:hypothetical protein